MLTNKNLLPSLMVKVCRDGSVCGEVTGCDCSVAYDRV